MLGEKLLRFMNWVFQKEGKIDHYRQNIHFGNQPVRVIHHMLVVMLQETYPSFFEELLENINQGKIDKELNLVYGDEPIKNELRKPHTPRVNFETKKIEIYESFLSFLWCCTYSIYVTYLETIDYPMVNKVNNRIVHPINNDNIKKARELFDYARYLVVHFDIWNKELLPNPEVYFAERRDYVEQTNLFYTDAVKFILCHEIIHLTNHVDKITSQSSDSHYLEFEIEADDKALEMMMKGISYSQHPFDVARRLSIENGIIFGILSMFFFSGSTYLDKKHPNSEDRLTVALEKLKVSAEHPAWGIACVGLQFWDEQFNLHFVWNKNLASYKDQYYDIVGQIKKRQ